MIKVKEMHLYTHTHVYFLYLLELNERKSVFLRFAFCFDFSEVSQGNLLCCLFQNRMMYSYHRFYNIRGIEDAFIDFILLLVKHTMYIFYHRAFHKSFV